MKAINTFVGILFVAAFAAGCQTTMSLDSGTGEMKYNTNWSTAGPEEAARAGRIAALTKIEAAHEHEEHLLQLQILRDRGAAERRMIEAQAQILETRAKTMDPDKSDRVRELIEYRKTLLKQYINCRDPERREAIEKASKGTRAIIDSILGVSGAPTGYYGQGMGGLPLMNPSLGGIGQPISMNAKDPSRGHFVSETDDPLLIRIEGQDVWIPPQGSITMNLPPGSYHYTAQRYVQTAYGTIPGATIGVDIQVDDKWNESLNIGWEARIRPWAFPAQ